MNDLKIGVVGYSTQKFDKEEAKILLEAAFDVIKQKYPNHIKIVVSGLTNIGIPALAYQEAIKRNWKTIGIACTKASEYDLFPVDKKIIIGNEWGDESETFIDSIDILIRIGGGKQSLKETEIFKTLNKPVIEFDLKSN